MTRVPGAPCRLALSAASIPPAPPPITSTSVSVSKPSNFAARVHHGRGLFFTEGCTSTICSGQKISQLKQVMQCSRYLMTGSLKVEFRPAMTLAARRRLHVNDIGRANDVADAATGAFFQFDTFNHELFRQLLSYFPGRFVQAWLSNTPANGNRPVCGWQLKYSKGGLPSSRMNISL